MEAILEAYKNKRSDYKNGGKDQKGDYLIARNNLFDALEELGIYVDSVALGDEVIIILAGYVPTKTTKSEKPLPGKPEPEISLAGSGSLAITCPVVPTASGYVAILTNRPFVDISVSDKGTVTTTPDPEGSPDRFFVINASCSREKIFYGLMPTIRYYVYYFAINTKGAGAISDPVNLVCS